MNPGVMLRELLETLLLIRRTRALCPNTRTPMKMPEANRQEIGRLCRQHGVKELHMFGSAVRDDFTPASDVDFLVEFDWADDRNLSARFFGLKSDLESLLGRTVDLVCYSAIRNPYFKSAIEEEKTTIYAA